MQINHIILCSFLLFSLLTSSEDIVINTYNISLGIPLNITNIKNDEKFIFNIETNNLKELRVKIIIPNMVKVSELKNEFMYIKEAESLNNFYTKNLFYFYRGSIKYLPNETIRFLFPYYIIYPDSNICSFEYLSNHNLDYFYIIIDSGKSYDLPIGITKNFTDMVGNYDYYFFILGAERFQTLNITVSAKSSEFYPFKNIFMAEYLSRTEQYDNYIIKSLLPIYNFQKNNKDIFTTNLIYEIKRYPTIALLMKFKYELEYLSIKIEVAGGEISFYDNIRSKNILNIKATNPYYFFTKTTQYQTSLITLTTNYTENYPFDYVEIYLYKNKIDNDYEIIKRQLETNIDFNNSKLILSSSYQTNSSDITDIAFKFIPKYDFDYIFAKMYIMGGHYYIYNEDIKKIYNVLPGCEILFWIKAVQYQTTIMYLKYSYYEENPIKKLDIYEYNYPLNNDNYFEHMIKTVYPTRKKTKERKEFSYIDSYETENEGTKYILLKINSSKFLEFLEIKIYIHQAEYDLVNNIPLKINKIGNPNKFHFFINANIYNQLFINFFFVNKTAKTLFRYIKINEYENRNDKSYIVSTNQTFKIKNNGNESFIDLYYKPKYHSTKYIAIILETNCVLDYLVIKAGIGGGYYEFYKNKNISKLIAGTTYYFPIKISTFQKIEMNIKIFDDNINNNPFTYANIYEKQKKEDDSYNKFYNITLINERISGKLVEYFTYPIDCFSTNYILIELIPNINLDLIEIKYEIKNIDYALNNGQTKNINCFKFSII